MIAVNFEDPEIIDSNGQKYRIGWDEHGYFTIQMVTLYPVPEEGATDAADTIEYEGETWTVEVVGEYPNTSFPRSAARQVIEKIESRL